MGNWVKRVASALALAIGLTMLPLLAAGPANASGATLLTTLGSTCTHTTRNIVRSNVTFSFKFVAGSAETISEFYLQRSSTTQAYDTLLWLDIYNGSTLLGTLNPAPNLTYSSGSFVFTALSGSVAIPAAGTYTALMRGGGANHYFCEAQDANTYGAAITLTSAGSAAGWETVEANRAFPSNYYSTYPLVKFVSGNDTVAPTLSSTQPSNNATGVTRSPAIKLNYSEALVSGSGQIQLVRSSDSFVVASWSTATAQVAGSSISLSVASPLEYGTEYHLLVDGGFVRDASGNNISAVSSSSSIRFTTVARDTTAPALISSSPATGQTGVTLSPRFTFTYSEAIAAGNGEVQLRRLSDQALVATASSQSFVVTGTGVTWTPSLTLSFSTSYFITLGTGVVRDLSDDANPNAEISDSATLRFTTLIEPDNTAPTLTISAKISSITTNTAVFVVASNEPLNCNSISTTDGVDFVFGSFSTISQVVAVGNTCELSIETNVAQAATLTISISPTVSFAISDLAGNVQTAIGGTASINISIPAPAPTPSPTPVPTMAGGYSGWTISAGENNWVRPGQQFQLTISLTCNDAMSLNSAPYYPSMYYMVMSNPWLNGYLSSAPRLSDDRKTATWTVNLVAPSSAATYEMYAYGRGDVCFGDSYNFANSARAKLVVQNNSPASASASPSVSPSASATISPNAPAGHSSWSVRVISDGEVNPGEQIQLAVSITCNREMRLNAAPYYPSMYYYLNSQPRINGVYGRPVISNNGRTAEWTVGVVAPMTIGRYVFQAYGRDNPFGSTCFGSSFNFAYSPGVVVEVVNQQPASVSPTTSPSQTMTPGYSSWRLTASGDNGLTAGSQIRLSVALTCNIAMSANSAPYFPSMYYLVNSPARINGAYGAPTLSADGKTATWTVTVQAPSAGNYTFVAYARDNPTGGTCFGDSYNFAYSSVQSLLISPETNLNPTPSATPTPSPTSTVEPAPSPSPTATSEPTATPTPSATPSAPVVIDSPVVPDAVVISGLFVQIQPTFLLAAALELGKSVEIDDSAIVRFRVGDGDWQLTTVGELKESSDPIDLAPTDEATGALEIEIVSAYTNQPLGVVSYDLETGDSGVSLTQRVEDSTSANLALALAVGFIAAIGFALWLFARNRRPQKESNLTSP